MKYLFCDTETYCETPISVGLHAYAENVEITLWAYAVGEGDVHVWDLTTGSPMPDDLKNALADESVMTIWHNSQFDRTVIRHALGIDIPVSRVHDTMVQAMCHSLPGSLDDLCTILRVPVEIAKIKDGKKLVLKFCKPLAKTSKIRRATRETHPDEWARFKEYAGNDITAMREVMRRLPNWNYKEFEYDLWQLDQKINDRGVFIDVALAQAAMDAVAVEQESLAAQTLEMTDGAVATAGQRDAILKHLREAFNVDLPDLRGATVERKLDDPDLPLGARELLLVRASSSTTSTAKYKKLVGAVSSDNRLRGTMQFCGATRTGRWAGRLVQLQNLPRPSLKNPEIERGIEALKDGIADIIAPDIMQLTSSAIRGCLTAPENKKLCIADLSNIEGRVAAWLAGEQWKLDAFASYDLGAGDDLYRVAYGRSFGVKPSEVTGDQRQIGKVMELAFQYQGALGAFSTFATAYSIDLEEMAGLARMSISYEVLQRSMEWREKAREMKMPDFGLTDDTWIVCDAIKASWRLAHPRITSIWKDLQEQIVAAIGNPDTIYRVRNMAIRREGNWLRIKLPGGRSLCYPSPEVRDDGKITYMGTDQYTRKWQRITTYGGKVFENICQAVARDVMASAMPLIEAAGYEIVTTVHDEIISETPDTNEFSADKLAALMATNPAWAKGLPLAAAGFESYRYRK